MFHGTLDVASGVLWVRSLVVSDRRAHVSAVSEKEDCSAEEGNCCTIRWFQTSQSLHLKHAGMGHARNRVYSHVVGLTLA